MNFKIYDFDPEPGNDFTYDEHGNVIYGCGFVGAPRLPFYEYGMDVNEFIDKYLQTNKEIRTNLLNNLPVNVSNKIINLTHILQIYENNQDKHELENSLDRFLADNLPNFRSFCYPQLKYFREFYNLLNKN